MDLCQPCLDALIKIGSHCYCCAKPLSSANLNILLCGGCQKNPPAFDKTYTPYLHQGITRYLINQLKYNHMYKNSRLLGLLLADHLRNNADMPELIIPMPLHPKRYRQRGYNQSLEIAKFTAHALQIPINNSCCQRIKNTVHQTTLTGKQRRKNIKNAFQIIQTPKAQHIAIIDDVLTTGATANELAKTFKANGVSRVDIWVCARA